MSKEKPKEKPVLDESGRVAAVMTAAGRSARVAGHLPDKYRKQLAALCDPAGTAVSGVREKVITILRAAGQENKATIDGVEEKE